MNVSSSARREIAGASVLVAGVDTPLGAAIARRLAAEVVPMALAGPSGLGSTRALDDVLRVRHLHRHQTPVPLFLSDVTTESGAESAVRQALDHFGRLDAAVFVAPPPEPTVPNGDGAPAMEAERLLPFIRWAAAALERQPGGRLVLATDLQGSRPFPPPLARRLAMDEAFAGVIAEAARAYFPQAVCINGVVVDVPERAAERSLALTAGAGADPQRTALLSAAAGTVELLLAAAGCSLTGQVFRLGRPPREPASAFEGRFEPAARLR